jgi:hypothetical protein
MNEQGSAASGMERPQRPPCRGLRVSADQRALTCIRTLRVSGSVRQHLWLVPWFHEDAQLRIDDVGDSPANDAARLAVGEERYQPALGFCALV